MAEPLTFGQRAADFAAARIGSWSFLIGFNVFVASWMVINFVMRSHAFDAFPYILLNLVFSWLAGVQAPLIMISQNRQEEITRQQLRYMLNMQEAVYASSSRKILLWRVRLILLRMLVWLGEM